MLCRWIFGKNKQGEIQGILNKDTHFAELAWIDESTIEKI